MMFEEDRVSIPRAYTALPNSFNQTDSAEDLRNAIDWCLEQAGRNAHRIGIQITSRTDINSEPGLSALVKSGASVHPDSRGKITSLPNGPVLVYLPTPRTLWQLEERRVPSAIAAVGISGPDSYRGIGHASQVGAQPWVSAYRPTHLGGPVIKPVTPVVPNPVVWEALKSFTDSINSSTGLSHSSDRSRVTEGLTKLKSSGYRYDPNDLLAGALALNWKGSAALELYELAREINDGKRKRYQSMLKPNIVEIWEKEAEPTGSDTTSHQGEGI